MKKSGTKRTLLLSICSIVLCLAMLVGTTFAWFTSTASTEINEIETGTLVIDIQKADGTSVKNQTLEFIKAEGGAGQSILWEPNCTYVLPEIKLVNTGSLALKCKLTASAPAVNEGKLLEVIDFTYKIGDEEFKLDEEITLLPGTSTGMITISAHMQETAGNEYQGKKLSGIKLVVTATQVPYEVDSIDNQYDASAEYDSLAELMMMEPGLENTVTIDGVEFYMIAKDGEKNQALLLTKNVVEQMQFSSDNMNNRWMDSDIRTYLNGEWLDQHPTLKKVAAETTLYTMQPNQYYYYSESQLDMTVDKVFLLSAADVTGYWLPYSYPATDPKFYSTGERLSLANGLVSSDPIVEGTEETTTWLLRSSGWGNTILSISSGGVDATSPDSENLAIRPVVWVKLS